MYEDLMRPTWGEYFMEIAVSSAKRSTCYSGGRGAAITVNNRIVAIGYAGAPSGVTSCFELRYCRKRALGYGHGEGHHECLAVHAEANAIVSAVNVGVVIRGGTIYCTHRPCESCAKLIINAGIKHVKYLNDYKSELAEVMFEQAGIKVEKMEVRDGV